MSNVIYLEGQDFSSDGRVASDGRPTVCMIKAEYCGHCKNAMPAFQNIPAMASGLRVCAIQADGEQSDKEAEAIVKKLMGGNFRGYPAYCVFDGNGKYVTHYEGGRDAQSIIEFCGKNL